jgi:hypothetical protein
MAEWKGTKATSKDPKSASSDPSGPEPENCILGGLGVMAVQFLGSGLGVARFALRPLLVLCEKGR